MNKSPASLPFQQVFAKLLYVIPYLQGASLSDEIPNSETLEAMAEVQSIIDTGTGEHIYILIFSAIFSKHFIQCTAFP